MSDLNPYADPNCPHCKGRGFIYGASMLDGGRYCDCALDGMRLDNMDRVWESLSQAAESPKLKAKPPLGKFVRSSAWITSNMPLFRQHLKAVCYNMSTLWNARVRTDAELLDAWFGTAKAQGVKIFDLDVERSTLRAIDIADLVEPPDLCIIILGVKKLPNKEAPGSLAEAISYRNHLQKPTWVVDQPNLPLDGSHKFFSDEIERLLSRWPKISLTPRGSVVTNVPKKKEAVSDAVHSINDMLQDVGEPAEDGETESEEGDFEGMENEDDTVPPVSESDLPFLKNLVEKEDSSNRRRGNKKGRRGK